MKQTPGFTLPHLPLSILLLITGVSFAPHAHSAASDIQIGIGVQHDDNVTRTMNDGNKISEQLLSLSISQPFVIPMTEHTRTIFSGGLDVEQHLDLDKLSNVSGRFQGEVQYRGSAEFGTPTYALFAKAALVEYQSKQRDGLEYSAGISIRKTFTDRINSYGAIFHHERDSQHSVFKNKYDAVLVNFDYSLREMGTLYLGGEYRDGNMAISAPWWPWYSSAPADFTIDDAFSNSTYSYRVNGSTQILKLGYNLPVGSSGSMDFFWNMAESTATYWINPGDPATKGSYTTNQYSIAYLFRF